MREVLKISGGTDAGGKQDRSLLQLLLQLDASLGFPYDRSGRQTYQF